MEVYVTKTKPYTSSGRQHSFARTSIRHNYLFPPPGAGDMVQSIVKGWMRETDANISMGSFLLFENGSRGLSIRKA